MQVLLLGTHLVAFFPLPLCTEMRHLHRDLAGQWLPAPRGKGEEEPFNDTALVLHDRKALKIALKLLTCLTYRLCFPGTALKWLGGRFYVTHIILIKLLIYTDIYSKVFEIYLYIFICIYRYVYLFCLCVYIHIKNQ